MRCLPHWGLRYFIDKFSFLLYQKMHPGYPWLTQPANRLLLSSLKDYFVGLEFGSGRSTLWFAQRVLALTSVEHDPVWYERVSSELKKNKINNVTYLLFPKDLGEDQGKGTDYVNLSQRFAKDSLDFVLVDGVYRSACANAVLEKIKPAGLLIIDNANWYLPSTSISPTSRKPFEGPISQEWGEFLASVRDWKCIWTSNGVTDTAIYIKPSLK